LSFFLDYFFYYLHSCFVMVLGNPVPNISIPEMAGLTDLDTVSAPSFVGDFRFSRQAVVCPPLFCNNACAVFTLHGLFVFCFMGGGHPCGAGTTPPSSPPKTLSRVWCMAGVF